MSPAVILATAGAGEIPAWLILPFGLLLLLIAVMPLTPPPVKHLWEKYYPHVAIGLGLLVAAYYLARIPEGGTLIGHTVQEYFSFIVLIGSLFVVAGGIHIKVKGDATPVVNVVYLAIAAVVANFIGTTGASMVLIRPWIRMNRIRVSGFHVVFFIFVVSNIGGALTPIGDPPLFLGYLRGVPFFWLVEHVVVQWLVTLAMVLAAFYAFDTWSFRRMPRRLQSEAAQEPETWRFDGATNVLFLGVIIGAVFLPERFFLREIVMLAAAAASYRTTPRPVHEANAFTFGPIKEVAFLFAGIFATMMPALGYLAQHGQEFGFTRPLQYYFASGALSSVLDNAPTYVNFLQLAQTTAAASHPAAFAGQSGAAAVRVLLQHQPQYVIAVSLGAVFFGAMTYIGNGPNFMVKSIAHDAGVHCPTFFGYMVKFSLPILLPILIVSGLLFL
ncbi:MAG: sodium:proton antiporter [Verrucomicrobia bacterium]|nr:sodium:proton antiporter [Verrucomicrobiota bacterium]